MSDSSECAYTFKVTLTSEGPRIFATISGEWPLRSKTGRQCVTKIMPAPHSIPRSRAAGLIYRFSALPGLIGVPSLELNNQTPLLF